MKSKEEVARDFENKPAGKVFPEAPGLIRSSICPTCMGPAGEFRDSLSRKEFEISGMCQKCQDGVFGV